MSSPPTAPQRLVLIVDPDKAWRRAVAGAVRRDGYQPRECGTAAEALDFVRKRHPGLVVIDIALQGITGYELCRQLREDFGEGLPIIFTSEARTEPLDRVGGLLIGADDYVTKPCDPDELTCRVRRLLPLDPPSGRAGAEMIADLTAREQEVLTLLASGASTPEIAEALVISVKTVGAHIQSILTKLGVHSQAQAVAKAYRAGFVEPKSRHPPVGSKRRTGGSVRA